MLEAEESHWMHKGDSPDTRRILPVAPLIGDKRCYGEDPASVRGGSGAAHRTADVRGVVGRRNARLAGSRFTVSLTWLKAVLLALRQIVRMNWQEMWSRDGPRP